jgi:outer membrane protein assembly factor BamB
MKMEMDAMFRRSLLTLAILASPVMADDWPQWFGPQRDAVWRETGIVDKFPEGGPKVLWRTPIGEGYSGPAVSGGKVYVTDRVLDKGTKNPENAFDTKTSVPGNERVLCLDEKDGKILWKHEYPAAYQISYAAGPRANPIVSGDKVYTLGAMGELLCLDANSGSVIWSKNFVNDYKAKVPMWGFAGSPLVDGNRLICLVGGPGATVVAFDKDTGKEIWKKLNAVEPGYAPPVIYDIDGKKTLIVWHPESVNGLDPVTGAVYWTHPFAKGRAKALQANLSIPQPRFDHDRLFLTAFYDGSLMLKMHGTDAPVEDWKVSGRSEKAEDTKALHSIMSTPIFHGDYIYGVDSYGELRCLDAKTGERLWSTFAATGGKELRWANAFIVEQGDHFVLFNELGDLILAKMTPKGYDEISKANILRPTNTMAGPRGRRVIWSHPAFADRSVFARNDEEIIRVSLAKEP